jgi:hypothetical protein
MPTVITERHIFTKHVFDYRTNKSDRDYRFVPQLVQNISSAEILDPHFEHLSDLGFSTFGLSCS